MRLTQTGRWRDHGETTLLVTDKKLAVWWSAHGHHLVITAFGKKGSAEYKYRLEISPTDLAEMVEATLASIEVKDVGVRAHGRATAAFIREAMKLVRKPAVGDDEEAEETV